jgi:hypothetical protein
MVIQLIKYYAFSQSFLFEVCPIFEVVTRVSFSNSLPVENFSHSFHAVISAQEVYRARYSYQNNEIIKKKEPDGKIDHDTRGKCTRVRAEKMFLESALEYLNNTVKEIYAIHQMGFLVQDT